MTRNIDIRTEAKAHDVKLWEIADRYGLTDGNFSKKLRHELSAADKKRIREIIRQVKKDREQS